DRELHAYASVPNLARHTDHRSFQTSVFSPRKALEPNPRTLPRTNVPQRLRGDEFGHRIDCSSRDYRCKQLSFADDCADAGSCNFGKLPGYRGANLSPIALILEPPYGRGFIVHLSLELPCLLPQVVDVRGTVSLLRHFVAFEPSDLEPFGVNCRTTFL